LWLQRASLVGARAVGDDLDAVDGQHSLGDHLVEHRHHAVDLLRRVDDLDHCRQVLRQPQDPRRVEVRVCPEALDAADHRCAGEPFPAHALDDRLV
jgi:hypothetical protein